MCSDILISIHPKHSKNVMNGSKTVELRRRRIGVQPGTRIWIYTTRPRARVDAFAIVDYVFAGSREELWSQFANQLAITREEFEEYFGAAEKAYAIVLREIVALKNAVALDELRRKIRGFHPPQFFKRLAPSSKELHVLSGSHDLQRCWSRFDESINVPPLD